MKNHIVENYENYKEENRLTTNNARKIEFLTTVRVMDELFQKESKILDCAAGTGIYAFYLADKGHQVTATDLTPRHIEIINKMKQKKGCEMTTAVLDATNMSLFADEAFDVVLNMGPFYHLITEEQRNRCLSESLRVLRKGGLLLTAYIPRFYVCQYVSMSNSDYLDAALLEQLTNTGVLRHDDEKCFWTDTYYATKQEMEELYTKNDLEIIDHFAQDGFAPSFADIVDKWDEEQFKVWCEHHYAAREASILGASNHVMIVGKKR